MTRTDRSMGSAWSFAVLRLVALLAIAFAGGLIFGRPLIWFIVVLAGYLCLQLANLYRLDRWLRMRNFMDPPDVGGAWADVVAQVVRLHRRKRFHKQRMMQLFRELRRSTAAMPDGVIVLNAAREIGVSYTTVNRWLNDHSHPDTLARQRLQDLGIDPDKK